MLVLAYHIQFQNLTSWLCFVSGLVKTQTPDSETELLTKGGSFIAGKYMLILGTWTLKRKQTKDELELRILRQTTND